MAEITKVPQGRDPHGEDSKHVSAQHGHGSENPNIAWERKDVNVLQITASGLGLLFACVIVAVLMWGLFDFLYSREDAKNATPVSSMMEERKAMRPPEPRLQSNPRVELQELRESEEAILENYGWLDPDKGIVRIPIETAIDMVMKRGLPSKPSPAGMADQGYRTIPSDANGGRTLEKIGQ